MSHPPSVGGRQKRLEAAVNREHPRFRTLYRLYRQSPELASYCLAKSLLLSEDRLLDRDVEMMKAALGRPS